jgi:hypothetical protein
MWIAVALGPKLSQPLAVLLDRVFVDIALSWTRESAGRNLHSESFADTFRDAGIALQRFSSLRENAPITQFFRPAPVCFEPVSYSPSALCDAADQAAGFAYQVGKLLEERLGGGTAALHAEIAPVECDGELLGRIGELATQTEELLRSGDFTNVVGGHRMLLRAQALCALLAGFRPLREIANPRFAATVPF